MEILEETVCEECRGRRERTREQNCAECGEGLEKEEETETVLVGMDVVSLFPSMTADTTGKIVRDRVMKSSMKVEGFRWKKAAIYIRLNRNLASKIPAEVRRYLPVRRKKQGVEPGMNSEGLKREEGAEEKQWMFTQRKITTQIEKQMMGIVSEIAIKILWRNYCYRFGGETKLQSEGGPIGQRPTMAASRIVMTDFFIKYDQILKKSGLRVFMLKVYVDDGRQVTTKLRKGMRYSREQERFEWN